MLGSWENKTNKKKQDYSFSDVLSKLVLSRKFDETELISVNNRLELNNVFFKYDDFEKSINLVIYSTND